MEKVYANNQVVKMRKVVRQAKLHVISRYVKKARNLLAKKGTEAQLAKNKKKRDNLLLQIEIVKKIVPDPISKMVLTTKANWNSVLNDHKSSLEDRALASVVGHKLIQAEVEKFRKENPYLASKISVLFEEMGSKETLKSKKSDQPLEVLKPLAKMQNDDELPKIGDADLTETVTEKSDSGKSKVAIKHTETHKKLLVDVSKRCALDMSSSDEDDLPKPELKIVDKHNIPENSSGPYAVVLQDEPLTYNLVAGKNSESVTMKKIFECLCPSDGPDSDEDDQSLLQHDNPERHDEVSAIKGATKNPETIAHENTEKSTTMNQNFWSKLRGKNTTKAIKPLNIEELEACDEIPIDDSAPSDNEHENTELEIVKDDPFFLGKDGEEIAVPEQKPVSDEPRSSKRHTSESHEEHTGDPHFFKKNRIDETPHGGSFDETNQIGGFRKGKKIGNRDPWKCHRSSNSRDERGNFKTFSKNNFGSKSHVNESTNRFSRNNFSSKSKNTHPVRSQNQTRNFVPKRASKPEILHPSWEAKRKLKEATKASTFQGKRTVFGD